MRGRIVKKYAPLNDGGRKNPEIQRVGRRSDNFRSARSPRGKDVRYYYRYNRTMLRIVTVDDLLLKCFPIPLRGVAINNILNNAPEVG
jgi:hypothetical protein